MDPATRRLYAVVAWASFAIVVVVFVYWLVESTLVPSDGFGYVLVNVEWPLPFFAKPITYFTLASVAMFYSGLRLWEERIRGWPPAVVGGLRIFSFVVAFASAYEVAFNFTVWGSLFAAFCTPAPGCAVNPDTISTTFNMFPWNLVFATKAFTTLFAVSAYSSYYLSRISRTRLTSAD